MKTFEDAVDDLDVAITELKATITSSAERYMCQWKWAIGMGLIVLTCVASLIVWAIIDLVVLG